MVSRLSGARSGLELSDPSAKQLLYAEQGRDEFAQLRATVEKLTVPQQRAILNEIRDTLVGGVYRKMTLHMISDGTSHEGPEASSGPACRR